MGFNILDLMNGTTLADADKVAEYTEIKIGL